MRADLEDALNCSHIWFVVSWQEDTSVTVGIVADGPHLHMHVSVRARECVCMCLLRVCAAVRAGMHVGVCKHACAWKAFTLHETKPVLHHDA